MTRYEDFISKLTALAHPDADRGPLAALRGANSGEPRDLVRVYPIVLPNVPSFDYGPSAQLAIEDACIQTACLFGIHPTPPDQWRRGVTLGRAMRLVMAKRESESIEQRFIALLRSSRAELLEHLRRAVNLARSDDVLLRWDDVLEALCRWSEDPSRRSSPQRKWAQDFWGLASAGADGERPAVNSEIEDANVTESGATS